MQAQREKQRPQKLPPFTAPCRSLEGQMAPRMPRISRRRRREEGEAALTRVRRGFATGANFPRLHPSAN